MEKLSNPEIAENTPEDLLNSLTTGMNDLQVQYVDTKITEGKKFVDHFTLKNKTLKNIIDKGVEINGQISKKLDSFTDSTISFAENYYSAGFMDAFLSILKNKTIFYVFLTIAIVAFFTYISTSRSNSETVDLKKLMKIHMFLITLSLVYFLLILAFIPSNLAPKIDFGYFVLDALKSAVALGLWLVLSTISLVFGNL